VSRTSTTARGSEAEDLVAQWIEAQGMRLVARNLRLGRLELDIVAREGSVVVVIEVRRRDAGSWTSGISSIDPAKRGRIRRAGERLWKARYRNDSSVDRMRFDVASVHYSDEVTSIEYVKAAF
jgi:putative endonuclease